MLLNFKHIRSREAINSQMMMKFNEILVQYGREVSSIYLFIFFFGFIVGFFFFCNFDTIYMSPFLKVLFVYYSTIFLTIISFRLKYFWNKFLSV